jgi:hypothetical protein
MASAPEFHQNKAGFQSKPLSPRRSGMLNRGLAAAYSGANSIASALHLLDGRDPTENQLHSNPELPAATSEPDISILRRTGHFYSALTLETLGDNRIFYGFCNSLN